MISLLVSIIALQICGYHPTDISVEMRELIIVLCMLSDLHFIQNAFRK